MEKEVAAKVTRLRRRLSTEAEESNSPQTPLTPSKKRGGRLAAKPQLELIDEDASENVVKRTPRKSIARDAIEPEEKVLTPARRSTRIKSNTSLLAAEVTPKVTESPRAKRAARRTSQLGSDNETPVAAPIRQTRRTRKDSTTSVDIAENENQTPVAATVKQPRRTRKDSTTSLDTEADNQTSEVKQNDTENSSTPSANKKVEIPANDDNLVSDAATENESKNDTKSNENVNESTPTIRKSPRLKDKIENTTPANKRKSEANTSFQLSEDPTQSAEIVNNVTPEKGNVDDALTIHKSLDEGSVISTADTKQVNRSFEENELSKNTTSQDEIVTNENTEMNSNSTQEKEIATNNTQLNVSKLDVKEKSDIEKLLENDPKNLHSEVLIDDSDSNSGKLVMDVPHETEDQCVPVIHSNQLVNEIPKTSDEPEPMDIDESMPLNVTLNNFEQFVESNTEFKNKSTELSKTDSIELKLAAKDKTSNISLNKSKRTSSISVLSEDNNEKNESKSKRTSSVSFSLDQTSKMDTLNKSKRTSYAEIDIGGQASNKSPEDALSPESNKENLTLKEKVKSVKKFSTSYSDDDINYEVILNQSNRKSSISLSENSKVNSPIINESKNKSRNSTRHSITANNTDTNSEGENQANQSKRRSLLKEDEDAKSLINITDKSINKSHNKNKSSTTVARADTQNLERSNNENKSTLVLSQLKDTSVNDTKNTSKSPKENNNELSKSVTVTDIAKNEKNNITNVLTSTPLQQKSMQKLTMQINTSMISPNIENKSVEMKTKKTSPVMEASDSDSSDDEDSAKNESKMIDDEASEASEDYESGDSRDEDEKQYEAENEILEKGETLESEQDFSNDSDYKRDSFVVSSDPEDNELLSGTENDLSLSDKELTMNKKSKKKFDERKRKEQKKASREMFEARHNLNKSNNNSQSKSKKKTKQLESSESESETEKPKKKNRMRIDSSHDASILKSDVDESIGYKKMKTKRLSVSVCEDTTTVNEKEITILNESVSNKNDPLSAAIKLEPKTPQRDFNISTVPIVDKIEEVEVGDMTVINSNETSDPLQTTMAQDEDSLSSENMEIIQNYDSVLNNLNDQGKVKTLDLSLNIKKKSGTKSKEPIIDQLNLTQTKKEKKNKSNNKSLDKKETDTKTNKSVSKVQEEESSDSIDMELLFPEDSNDSEVSMSKMNNDKKTAKPGEEYIPLKKVEGKTHIPENTYEPSESLNFFVDVTGDLNVSGSKKSNKMYFDEVDSKQSNSVAGENNVVDVTVNDEAPTEVSFKIDKKKKKHKLQDTSTNESIVYEEPSNNVLENRDTEVAIGDQIENKEPNQSLNISVKSDKKKKDKKKLEGLNVEMPGVGFETQSANKKSRKSSDKLADENVIVLGTEVTETVADKSFNFEKKKKHNTSNTDKSHDNSRVTEQITWKLDVSLKSEKNKKKKQKNNDVSINQSMRLGELFHNETMDSNEDVVPEPTSNTSQQQINTSLKSEKKKKKKRDNKEQNIESKEQATASLDPEVVTSSKKKKKQKYTSTQPEDSDGAPEEVSFTFEKATEAEITKQKSKKRKMETEEAPVGVQSNKSKKKRRISDKVENSEVQDDTDITQKSSKKRKRQEGEMEQQEKKPKVPKEHSLDKIHIPRLPLSILEQLDDEPPAPKKKGTAIATSAFIVEDAQSRKNKPSTYLEQSVYLNDTPKKNKKKQKVKRNPVLPFLPTATTSDEGFTSNFKINVASETPFVANITSNFKSDYLAKQRVKKLGTFERYKAQRSHKLCKF